MEIKKKPSNCDALYVVGFPKSGNTWLARLIADITQSNISTSNEQDVVNAVDNSKQRKGRFTVYKLHQDEKSNLPSEEKIVYIIRDVRDVLVSAFFFNNNFVKQSWVLASNTTLMGKFWRFYYNHQTRRMNKRWRGNEFSSILNIIHGQKEIIGDWSEHVRKWANRPNTIVVKYEDLLHQPEVELKRILLDFGLEIDDETISQSISNQSFSARKSDFTQSGDKTNARFLRSGRVGDWKMFNIAKITREIEEHHQEVMKLYDYEMEFMEK